MKDINSRRVCATCIRFRTDPETAQTQNAQSPRF